MAMLEIMEMWLRMGRWNCNKGRPHLNIQAVNKTPLTQIPDIRQTPTTPQKCRLKARLVYQKIHRRYQSQLQQTCSAIKTKIYQKSIGKVYCFNLACFPCETSDSGSD